MSIRNSVMVIGAGRFGSNVAKMLSNRNESVLVCDKNENAFDNLEDFSGFLSCFDALDNDSLIENGIRETKMVVVATDRDDVNIYIADVCLSIFNVPKIYVKLDDSRKRALLDEKIGVITPFDLSIDDFNRKYENN